MKDKRHDKLVYMIVNLRHVLRHPGAERLLSSQWRKRRRSHPLEGHCYVASEALYHLMGGKAAGWKPMCLVGNGWTHWWIEHPELGRADVTYAQFPSGPNYSKGRGKGFMTKQPSKRAQVLVSKLAGKFKE